MRNLNFGKYENNLDINTLAVHGDRGQVIRPRRIYSLRQIGGKDELEMVCFIK